LSAAFTTMLTSSVSTSSIGIFGSVLAHSLSRASSSGGESAPDPSLSKMAKSSSKAAASLAYCHAVGRLARARQRVRVG
jgi:hypothetical protein